MKKILLILYILISGSTLFAQVDSLEAWETGKAIAEGVQETAGVPKEVIAATTTIAAVIFGWIWRRSHKRKKAKKAEKQ